MNKNYPYIQFSAHCTTNLKCFYNIVRPSENNLKSTVVFCYATTIRLLLTIIIWKSKGKTIKTFIIKNPLSEMQISKAI